MPCKFHANSTQIPCKFHANIMCLPLSPAEVSNPSSCSPESRFQPPTVFLVHFELVTSLESGGNQHSSLPPFGSRTRGSLRDVLLAEVSNPSSITPESDSSLLLCSYSCRACSSMPCKFHANSTQIPTQIPCKFHANIMCLPLSPADVSNPSSCSPESRFQPPTVFLVHFELVTSLESGGNQHSSLPPFGSRTRGLVEGCVACRSLSTHPAPTQKAIPASYCALIHAELARQCHANSTQIPRKSYANPMQISCKYNVLAFVPCRSLQPIQLLPREQIPASYCVPGSF